MRLLLISSSVVHGYGFLDHAEPELRRVLAGVSTVAFVPFAHQDHDAYTSRVRERLAAMELDVSQVRSHDDVEQAEAIFIGGGNTFRLLKELYERELLDTVRARVRAGVPYIGSSAGTNVATPSIRTTNDMPIVYPPSFDALGLVPFQINPHYLDPDPSSTHKGETREERIREFHEENTTPVIGLREGSMLEVNDGVITLLGAQTARLFRRGQEPEEIRNAGVLAGWLGGVSPPL
ncbi:MAG TPA: dipeptidase PepE [Thermoanaerobaculia bacterium]|nr:dipeptidase PepE [Thermoanaerobaculia bacterium]